MLLYIYILDANLCALCARVSVHHQADSNSFAPQAKINKVNSHIRATAQYASTGVTSSYLTS